MIDQTIKGAVAEYLENITSRKALSSQKTEPIYFRNLEQYFTEKNIEKISEITPKDCEFLQSNLLKSKQASTVNRQFTLYDHFFRKCVEWNYIDKSPTRFLKKKKEIEPTRKLFKPEEIEKIIANTDGWFRDAFHFLSETGCRPVEMSGIRKQDLFLADEYVKLHCDKKSKGTRLLPLNRLALDILTRLASLCESDQDYLFKTEYGTRVETSRINKRLKSLLKRLKIEHKSIYSLRHGYATNLCNRNVNLEKVRLLLGHSQIRTTQKYIKIDFLELKKVVNGG